MTDAHALPGAARPALLWLALVLVGDAWGGSPLFSKLIVSAEHPPSSPPAADCR